MKVKSIKANQIEVTLSNGDIVFLSYQTPVAAFISGKGVLVSQTKYSRTTSRHINEFIARNCPAATETKVSQSVIDKLMA